MVMAGKKIDAFLALRSDGKLLIGRDRIEILEAIAEHKSISKAAKAVGFSYKGAWDAVAAINNLLPTPAFITKAGGKTGGGAEITPEGRKLIDTFRHLEQKLSRISSLIAAEGLAGQDDFLLWSIAAKISARNVFQAEVVSIKKWPVDVEVTLRISDELRLVSIITNEATSDLELKRGRRVVALIKSSLVSVSSPSEPARERYNRFHGLVTRRTDAERNCELLIDIGGGKTMTAVQPRSDVESAGIGVGTQVFVDLAFSNVILLAD
jgi:molybdate transport system regulatory protein